MQTLLVSQFEVHAPKLQSIENGLKVDRMVIALEMHELLFHCFNEVDIGKELSSDTSRFIILTRLIH